MIRCLCPQEKGSIEMEGARVSIDRIRAEVNYARTGPWGFDKWDTVVLDRKIERWRSSFKGRWGMSDPAVGRKLRALLRSAFISHLSLATLLARRDMAHVTWG